MANVHPWFADVTVQQSADWTYTFFQQNDVALANNLTNKPTMYIAETGWPTVSCFLIVLSPSFIQQLVDFLFICLFRIR